MKAGGLLSFPFANDALRDQIAVVCGSTQGIGFAAAEVLARMGARVILVARNEDKLKACVAELPRTHLNHSYLVADFSMDAEVDALAEKLRSLEVNILVNNTGGPAGGKIVEAQPMAFLEAFHAHLLANHKLTTAVLPAMKKQGYGRIINVISTSVKQPLPNLGVSNTIRGAVANWAKTMASEVAPFGITVNNVLPGATATGRLENIIANKAQNMGKESSEIAAEMTREIPSGRFGEAEEIAYAIGFLASPYAAYINGINLPVDGGRTASL